MDKKRKVTHKVTHVGSTIASVASTINKDEKVVGYTYIVELQNDVEEREKYKIIEEDRGEEINLTPKNMPEIAESDKFLTLGIKVVEQLEKLTALHSQKSITTSQRGRSSARIGGLTMMKQSIEEIISGIAQEKINFDLADQKPAEEPEYKPVPYKKAFIKIVLKKTDDFDLYSQNSNTAERGTLEGEEVEKDNRYYDYITTGKGKVRRRSDADAQTDGILMKTRAANTTVVTHASVGCYVSNFEMYDTLHQLLSKASLYDDFRFFMSIDSHSSSRVSRMSRMSRMSNISAVEETRRELKVVIGTDNPIYTHPRFQLAKMIMGRTLSSNMSEAGMRRFRNFEGENRYNKDAIYNYGVNLLFRCIPSPSNRERKACCDISFCPTNGDIFAVAYGIYSFSSKHVPKSGDLFVWSIKNPGEPERAFYYTIPVTAVCFSPFVPSLIAIGLFDGAVEVRDITHPSDAPIAISQRSTSPSCAPVVAIRWIKQSESGDFNEIDPFLSLSQDGSVTRYRIIKSPHLLGFNQMTLERVEGIPEGITAAIQTTVKCEANRNPQGLNMVTHPLYPDIYYVLTDEGCIHKCSTNYQHQYLEVLKCHDGSVLSMEFSPWSPKLFLTCGSDWYLRIWIDGIFKPLIELCIEFMPINCASWSPTHSTVLLSLTRAHLHIWDIRRNILKPMSSHAMDSSYNTTFCFNRDGRTVVVGNERGNVLFQGLDNMPFPPHFQYDELERAIYKAVGNDQELLIELKSVGFFGYPKKEFVRPV